MGFGTRWPEDKLPTKKAAPVASPAPAKVRKPTTPKPLVFGPPEQSEFELQVSCHQHYKSYCPSLWWELPDGREAGLGWMNKNDGKKTEVAGARDKAQGLTPGVPDWQLAVARRGYHGLYVEFKTLSGSASPAQKLMHKALELQGYCVAIIRTLADFGKLLQWYLGPLYKLTWQ